MEQDPPGQLAELEKALGHTFSDLGVLRQALIHRSYLAETDEAESNERMEFLGDAILQLVITDLLYNRYPFMSEGSMARIRSGVVNGNELAEVARELGLGEFLLLSRGEDANGGRDKDSILADAMEAVLAAVYLDGGMTSVSQVIRNKWADRLVSKGENPLHRDPKSLLYEQLAGQGTSPSFEVTSQGPDHDKVFTAVVTVDGTEWGRGLGNSKKEAQQQAAEQALDALAARVVR